MNPVPFLWLAAVVGFLLLEASTFSMTSVLGSRRLSCRPAHLPVHGFVPGAGPGVHRGKHSVPAGVPPLAAKLRQKTTPTNGDRNLGREATVLTTINGRPAGPCAAGRRGLECPLRHSRRHSTPGQRCRVTELHSTLLIVEPVLTESRRA